ncbi:MAG: LamG domain-containing protein, partial [Pedobacter sp.]
MWSDYKTVFHFNDDTYSGTTKDATTLGLVGTNSNMTGANLVNAKVGKGYSFNGSNQKIAVESNAAYAYTTGPFTLSAWVNTISASTDQKVISNQNGSSIGYKLGLYGSKPENQNNGDPNRDGGSNVTGTSFTVANSTWYHLQGVYNGTTLTIFVNGVQRQSRTSVGSPGVGMNLNIGVGEGGTGYWFNGILDEVRTTNVAKTAAWALSEYRNQNNPTITGGAAASIVSIGSLEADATLASTYPGLIYTYTGPAGGSLSISNYLTNNTSNLANLPVKADGKASLIIPAGKSPKLTSAASFYGVSLISTSSLDLNGNTLNVGCNVYNNGVITGNTGTLNFNGTSGNQEYFGNATTSSVGTLSLNNLSGSTININSGKLDVYQQISVNNNDKLNIDPSSTFTIKSTVSGFVNVAPLAGSAEIIGEPNVELFFTGGAGKRGTRLVSPPVNDALLGTGSKFYQQLKTGMVITGPDGVTNGFDPGNSVRPFAVTLSKYTESFAPGAPSQFTSVSNINNNTVPLAKPGEGFFLFYRGNRANYNPVSPESSTKLGDSYVPESFSPVFKGTLNQKNVQVNITHSDNPGDLNNGYNVLGNPYQATIDWELVYAANSSLVQNEIRIIQPGGAMMVRTKAGVNPPVVVNAIGNSANAQFIQPGQGFYVRKSDAGTSVFNFNEDQKAIASTPNRLLSSPVQNGISSNLKMGLKDN